ncbi:hypothetical protein F5882DRAFT_261620, partial [Hyaloscypha sp. PMI_1271]
IRLLRIHPTEDPASIIKCDIESASVFTNLMPVYEVLSFVSEEDGEPGNIQIGGCNVQVTMTLESALRNLREKERTRSLWVRQLCVQDRNAFEHVHTLERLLLIHKIAQRVIIWIGDES